MCHNSDNNNDKYVNSGKNKNEEKSKLICWYEV